MANRTHERLLSPLLTHMQWHIPMGHTHMPSPTCRASWLRAPETQHTPCSEQMRALLHKCQLRHLPNYIPVAKGLRLVRRLSSPIIIQTLYHIFYEWKISQSKKVSLTSSFLLLYSPCCSEWILGLIFFEKTIQISFQIYTCVCMCVYIYTHTHTSSYLLRCYF